MGSDWPVTPVMSRHARERCAEMGISTKVAKDLVRNPDVTRPASHGSNPDAKIAVSDRHPDYAAVFCDSGHEDIPVVISVVFRTTADYARDGESILVLPDKGHR